MTIEELIEQGYGLAAAAEKLEAWQAVNPEKLHADPGVNARLHARLARVRTARDHLLLTVGLMDMVIAEPSTPTKNLAARLGTSAEWFNAVVREGCRNQ